MSLAISESSFRKKYGKKMVGAQWLQMLLLVYFLSVLELEVEFSFVVRVFFPRTFWLSERFVAVLPLQSHLEIFIFFILKSKRKNIYCQHFGMSSFFYYNVLMLSTQSYTITFVFFFHCLFIWCFSYSIANYRVIITNVSVAKVVKRYKTCRRCFWAVLKNLFKNC